MTEQDPYAPPPSEDGWGAPPPPVPPAASTPPPPMSYTVPPQAPQGFVTDTYTPQNSTIILVMSILSLFVCPFVAFWSFFEANKAKKFAAASGLKLDQGTMIGFIVSIVGLVFSAIYIVLIALWVIIVVISLAAGGMSSAAIW